MLLCKHLIRVISFLQEFSEVACPSFIVDETVMKVKYLLQFSMAVKMENNECGLILTINKIQVNSYQTLHHTAVAANPYMYLKMSCDLLGKYCNVVSCVKPCSL